MTTRAELKVAVCQMTSIDEVEANFAQITSLLNQVPSGYDLACFPENSLYMRVREGAKVPGIHLHDEVFHRLSHEARTRNLTLHLGSVPLRTHGKLQNSSVVISPDGNVRSSYFKIHLFDIDIEGQASIRESDVYEHGEKPEIFQLQGWHLGQTICYDLRFSELFSYYAQHSVEVILVPAAFLVKTGQAHWEVLLRARAIESQAYVVAAAQAGVHRGQDGASRETFGHSVVIDPWGQVVAEAKTLEPEVLLLSLSLDRVQSVRRQIPMKNHRRLVQVKR